MLRLRTDAWNERQERIGHHATSAALTALKKTPEHAWLREVSAVPIQQALRHLQTAFANFVAKRAQYPAFRRKDGTQSAEYTRSAFKWDGKALTLAKMAAPLAIRWSRTLPNGAKPTAVTVSRDTAGRYHVSMLCRKPRRAPDAEKPPPGDVDRRREPVRIREAVGVQSRVVWPHADRHRPRVSIQ